MNQGYALGINRIPVVLVGQIPVKKYILPLTERSSLPDLPITVMTELKIMKKL
jgi:hypothetical protein